MRTQEDEYNDKKKNLKDDQLDLIGKFVKFEAHMAAGIKQYGEQKIPKS